MIIELIPEDTERFMQQLRDRNEQGQERRFRTTGFHVAGLLRSIYKESGLAASKGYTDEIDDDALMRFELGYAWEEILARHYINGDRTRPYQLDTLDFDGVLFTVDGFDEADAEGKGRVREYKATWRSRDNFDVKNEWSWLHQMRAYCYALDMDEALLGVLFVAGNYKPPRPVVEFYRIVPSQREKEATWKMLMDEKKRLEAMGLKRV